MRFKFGGMEIPPSSKKKEVAPEPEAVQQEAGPIEHDPRGHIGYGESPEHPLGNLAKMQDKVRQLILIEKQARQKPHDFSSSEGLEPVTSKEGEAEDIKQLPKEDLEELNRKREIGDTEPATQPATVLDNLGRYTAKDNFKPLTKSEIAKAEKEEEKRKARDLESVEVKRARQAVELAKDIGLTRERNAMLKSLDARRSAYAAFLKSEQEFKKLKRPSDEQKLKHATLIRELKDAEEKHKQEQLKMSQLMIDSVKDRLRDSGRDEAYIKRAVERYKGLIQFNEVVRPAIEMKKQARIEALESKKKGIFEKAMNLYTNLNKKAENGIAKYFTGKKILGLGKPLSQQDAERLGRATVRAARILGFATLGSGAAVLGGAGLGAVVGVGFAKLGIGLANLGISTGAGWGAGELFERTTGKKRKELFAEARRKDLANFDDLEGVEAAEAKGGAEAIRAARAVRENVVGAVTGAGTTLFTMLQSLDLNDPEMKSIIRMLTGHNTAHDGAGEAVSSTPAQTPGEEVPPATVGEATVAVVKPSIETDVTSSAAVAHESGTVTPSAEGATIAIGTDAGSKVEIGGSTNNADRLLGRFGDQMEDRFQGKEAPKSVSTLLEMLKGKDGLHGQDVATLKLKLQMPDGTSAVMQPGDTVSLNEKGEIVFDRPGHPELRQVLIDAEGKTHEAKGFDMKGVAKAPVAETEPTPGAKPEASTASVRNGVTVHQRFEDAVAATKQADVLAVPSESVTPIEPETADIASSKLSDESEPVPVRSSPVDTPAVELAPEPPQSTLNVDTQEPVDLSVVAEEQRVPEESPLASQEIIFNRFNVPIDARVPHIYGEGQMAFAFGGETKEDADKLIASAQAFAIENNKVVWLDASYVNDLGETVPRSQGFEPDGKGGTRIIITEDPRYRVDTERFQSLLR